MYPRLSVSWAGNASIALISRVRAITSMVGAKRQIVDRGFEFRSKAMG